MISVLNCNSILQKLSHELLRNAFKSRAGARPLDASLVYRVILHNVCHLPARTQSLVSVFLTIVMITHFVFVYYMYLVNSYL